ncbi:hypothetical protein B0A68_08995 [Flavobacterium reichenbachii]|nr:hypothetical protein B0A68_08995 [Flavobacterium reichenbachii]
MFLLYKCPVLFFPVENIKTAFFQKKQANLTKNKTKTSPTGEVFVLFFVDVDALCGYGKNFRAIVVYKSKRSDYIIKTPNL